MSSILSLVLSFMPIVDTIVLSSDLHLDAEYMPKDSTLKREGMLLSVEDFVVIKGELETSAPECETRVLYVQDLAHEEIKRVSKLGDIKVARLERLAKKYNSSRLSMADNLKRLERSTTFYQIVSSVLVGSTVILSIILYIK